jgi:outer membrane protein OmpA-like peptidoglycan-associated protein
MAEEAHKEEHGGAEGGHGGGGHGGGGHGGGHEEGHEGAPEWLISFADNVALLMGFFVILLAMNMGPKASPVQGGVKDANGGGGPDMAMETIISIREAFKNAHFDPNDPDDAKIIKYMNDRANAGTANEEGISGSHQNVEAIRTSDYKNVTGRIPFDDRSAVLSALGREKVLEVAGKLRDQRWIIEVRGHVAPFEEMRDVQRGWRLSNERAQAVGAALIEAGLRPENLRLVACGSYDRVVTRTYDQEQDRQNQRVEIIVTTEVVPQDPYAGPGEKAKDEKTPGEKEAPPVKAAGEHEGGDGHGE